jgi:hypothetical protein
MKAACLNFVVQNKILSMSLAAVYEKALSFGFVTVEEGLLLYTQAPLTELMMVADELRKKTSAEWKSNLADRSQCQYDQCLHS